MNVSSTGSLSEAVEDVAKSFSIRFSSLVNNRPIWTFTFVVDQFSFCIGAIGGVGMGYLMDQYSNPHFYYDDANRRANNSTFSNIVHHVVNFPFNILQRFIAAGCMYTLFGYLTMRMFKPYGWGSAFVRGSLTGIYFAYGGNFLYLAKAGLGFAGFSLLSEILVSLIV